MPNAVLKITSIKCINQQEENSGSDEVYFKFSDQGGTNNQYYSQIIGGFDPGDKIKPNPEINFAFFTGKVKVELRESDANNSDELLQSFTVDAHNQEHGFWQRSDALYDVQHDYVLL